MEILRSSNIDPARIDQLLKIHFEFQQDSNKNDIRSDDEYDDNDSPPLLPYAQQHSTPPYGAGPRSTAPPPYIDPGGRAARSPPMFETVPPAGVVGFLRPGPPPPYQGVLASHIPSVVAELPGATAVSLPVLSDIAALHDPFDAGLVPNRVAVLPVDVLPALVPMAARHRASPRGRGSLTRALRLLADHGSPGRAEQREARAIRYGPHVHRVLKRPPAGVTVRHPVSTRWFYEAI